MSVLVPPRTHKLLETHINKFVASDENPEEFRTKVENIVDEQQSQNSFLLSAFSELLNQFVGSALDLLNFNDSRDTSRCKLAGLIVFDCLLDVNDDLRPERKFEIANHLCKILESDKSSETVLRTAALSVGHFVRIASRTEVDHFGGIAFQLALKLVSDARSELHRFAGALIMSELSKNAPAFIFVRRQNIFTVIWDLVCDRSAKVRDAAAEALEAGLQVVSQREAMDDYLQQALHQINFGFQANTLEKNLSSLIILDIIVNGVVSAQDLQATIVAAELADDLIWKVLQRRDSRDEAVRQKVIEIIPNLADAFPINFVHSNDYTGTDNFLTYCLNFLMGTIRAKRLRSAAYLSLGNLCLNMSNQLRAAAITDDVVAVICEGFREPFCVEALESLGMIVSSLPTVRRFVDDQLVDMTFKGGLTSSLVECLKILSKYVPAVRDNVRSQLRVHISKILKKYTVLIDEVRGPSRVTQQLRLAKVAGRNPSLPATSAPPAPPPTSRGSTMMRWGLTSAPKPESPVNLPPGTITAEEELIFALNLLTMTEFFPKQLHLTVRARAGSNASAATEDGDQTAQLLLIVRQTVVPYLDDYNAKLRSAASKACAAVLDSAVMAVEPAAIEYQYLLQILDRLLLMGVGDDSQEIRVCVFSSLTHSMDSVISYAESIHCLIEAINDESLEVRIAAMKVIARVAHHDTLHIMPVMRLTMKRLILTLLNSKDATVKRESVQLLQALINGAHHLIVPYVRQVIEPLMSLLNASSVDVVAALSTIGDLAVASPESVREHLTVLSPLLIEALNDTTSVSKQETAVIAMGKLVSSLTIEVTAQPYKRYHGLFEGLVRAIQSKDDSSSVLRLQAIKTVGLLGIVDIHAFESYLTNIKTGQGGIEGENDTKTELHEEDSDSDNETDAGDGLDPKLTRTEKAYFSVVTRELMKILRDSSLAHYHVTAATVAIRVLRILGPQAAQAPADLKELFSGLMHRIYLPDTPSNTRESLLDHVLSIIVTVPHIIPENLEALVQLVRDFAETHLQMCLNLVEALSAASSKPHFYLVLKGVLPTLLAQLHAEVEVDSSLSLDEATFKRLSSKNVAIPAPLMGAANRMKSSSNPFYRTNKILRLLNQIVEHLGEYRVDLIAVVIRIVDCGHATMDIRKDALCTVMFLANNVDLLEFASRIIHPLMRVVDKMDPSMQCTIVTALSSMVCRLGRGYIPYIIPVRRKLRFIALRESLAGPGKSRLEEYESLVNRLLKQRPLPPEPSDMSDLAVTRDDAVRSRTVTSRSGVENMTEFDLTSLETVWTLTERRSSSADLTEWMKRLNIELIRQSTSPIIRTCTSLATAYRPLAQGLFYIAFHCIWNELYAAEHHESFEENALIAGMETALRDPQSSKKYIAIPLLKLAEYMEMQDMPLSIDTVLLSNHAKRANMFAKCLYTREIEFSSKNFAPSNECIDALIDVNNQLGLTDNAVGMLQYVRAHYPDISIQSAWLEKLCRWEDAKKSYDEERMRLFSQSFDSQDEVKRSSAVPCSKPWVSSMLGKMRCLYALGEYEQLEECATALKNQIKGTVDVSADGFNPWDYMSEVQRLGAHATWMLGKWSAMEAFLEDEHDDDDGAVDVVLDKNVSFYRAIMAIHNKDYDRADLLISETRSELAGSIGSLLSEKYSRAYRALVTMQVLAEMEEIVDYKRYVDRAVASEKEASKNASSTELIVDAGHQRSGNQTSGGPVVISPTVPPTTASGKDPVGGTTAPPTSTAAATAAMTMKLNDINAKKYNLILKWRGRLESAPKEVDVYRQILSVHTLVTEPTEDLDSWLDLVTLCRKERMHSLCENILRKLGAPLLQRKDSEVFGDAFLSSRDPSVSSRELSLKEQLEGVPGAPVTSPTTPGLSGRTNDRVMLSTFEYWWAIGEKARALSELTDYLKVVGVPHRLSSNTRRYSTTEATMFRVECLLKRADWNRELNTTEVSVKDTMATLLEARELAGDRYSVWHAWAVANYDWLKKADKADSNKPASEAEAGGSGATLATTNMPFSTGGPGAPVGTPPTGTQYSKGKTNRASRKLGGNASQGSASLLSKLSSQQVDSVTPYIVEAIRGFVRSITLGNGQPIANVLQDTLRLITLWFSYGTKKGVFHILEAELEWISPDHWLAVVPQLIARIHIKSPEISGLLKKLLSKVAVAHPQALVCPISVAMNTSDVQQREVAMQVLQEMRKSRSQLVEEATMVSRELMRVAITPHELWYDGLEQAAQLYMDSKDIHGMLAVLDGLHDAMAETSGGALSPTGAAQEGFAESMGKIGYTTLRDISFRHCYSKSIREAQHWLIQFKASMCTADLHQAWETYQQLFKRIKVQIVNLKKLELHHVSPALTSAADLSLAVPGTYRPGATDIGIKSFAHFIGVIASKQRPRRMSMQGSDGNRYEFLLKGHEDLRQDERVMQLFGLINACLNNDNLTNNRGLEIVRYSVLPLSNNSGVIGWVQNCDTINQLIKQYREAKEMRLLIEVKLLHAKCPYYDKLPVIHKVDLFRQVLEETTGKDLAKMLWLKSKTSDVWIERRANFTKSMAVMSMAGYILGLGDRHPSNLMLDRLSGRVVHIDFGDCFEITSQRAKFPEIVPFRLTRMLTNCMGPAGIQGSYRLTCERVMSVLRDNRDSVMAMLEAFVYDPLISWRLLATNDAAETAVPIASGNLRSHASMEDDSVSKSSVEQLRVQMAAGSLLGGAAAAPTMVGGIAGSPILRNQSMRNQSMRDMKAQLAAGVVVTQDGEPLQENLNARALEVINRIQAKLTGRDFATNEDADDLTVEEQVERLIAEATSIENLCQLFTGWCPLW